MNQEIEVSDLPSIKTGSGAHPASYLSPGLKRQGCGGDISAPSNAEVKKVTDITPLFHMSA
jgi:hypothetical protein